MKKYKCTVDVPNGYFNVQGRCVKVDFVGKIGCFRISAIETDIRINRACRNQALVASSMGYLKGGLIPVRFMNLSEDSQIVYPVTLVASLSNVDVLIDSSYDQEYHCDYLPPHLEDLFARSTEQLKVGERSALK